MWIIQKNYKKSLGKFKDKYLFTFLLDFGSFMRTFILDTNLIQVHFVLVICNIININRNSCVDSIIPKSLLFTNSCYVDIIELVNRK